MVCSAVRRRETSMTQPTQHIDTAVIDNPSRPTEIEETRYNEVGWTADVGFHGSRRPPQPPPPLYSTLLVNLQKRSAPVWAFPRLRGNPDRPLPNRQRSASGKQLPHSADLSEDGSERAIAGGAHRQSRRGQGSDVDEDTL